MINSQTYDTTELKSWVQKIITDEYINTFKNGEIYQKYGEHPIEVYLVSPSNELPYGWEKDKLNIDMNFDQSVFYRNSHITVTIPVNAHDFDDCIIKNIKNTA